MEEYDLSEDDLLYISDWYTYYGLIAAYKYNDIDTSFSILWLLHVIQVDFSWKCKDPKVYDSSKSSGNSSIYI